MLLLGVFLARLAEKSAAPQQEACGAGEVGGNATIPTGVGPTVAVTPSTVHRLVVAGLLVAAKFSTEKYYTNVSVYRPHKMGHSLPLLVRCFASCCGK
jgi:hypothetical protein